jgi:SH3-like domain-containing protein
VTTEARPPTRALSGAAAPLQNVAQPAAPEADAQPTSAPAAAPTTAPATDKARVAHTDGTGVVLRASPQDADRTPRGFMDGTDVTVLERQGSDWARVRGPNGQEGWIPARFLEAG